MIDDLRKERPRATLVALAEELQMSQAYLVGNTIYSDKGIIGWPYAWQRPAATEEAAWKSMVGGSAPQLWFYIGFPWATLIDGLQTGVPLGWKLLRQLEQLRKHSQEEAQGRRMATVCQHIHCARFIEIFRKIGVTDLFWSHAVKGQPEISGVKIHGFPLYPAQVEKGEILEINPGRPKKWCANFIGAYNPAIYLSSVRARIFEDIDQTDLLVIKREGWHFDRAVYNQQIAGVEPDRARLVLEETYKQEYLQAIRDSTFTLCPTGSGPNSIRIYEALCLGSIPVILTRDLALPGEAALWEAACVFEEDSAEGYVRASARIRAMSKIEVRDRQAAIQDLFDVVGPRGYAELIKNSMAPKL